MPKQNRNTQADETIIDAEQVNGDAKPKDATSKDFFARQGSSAVMAPLNKRFRALKRLTRPVVAIGRVRQLALQCQSEMYERKMPLQGKGEVEQPTTVVDILDLETGEECLLICNALIKTAFERACGKLLPPPPAEAGQEQALLAPRWESPLTGRYFAMQSGEIRDGKRYRDIDIVELHPTE
jgi:hypothetical protein